MCRSHQAWEGAANRMIRESEDLSEHKVQSSWTEIRLKDLEDKKGHPRVD